MRLHLNLTAPVLTLVFALTAPEVFSMGDLSLQHTDIPNIQSISSTAIGNPLFSIEEWTDIQIGSGIIQDRIKQKQEILSCISKKDTPLFDKMQRCQDDFGVVPYGGQLGSEDSIQIGISRYCEYIENLLDVYTSANQIVQLLVSAGSQEEKDKHQNNLYYLLSFNAKYFRGYIAQLYTHKIPEHSLEDTFYEMISLKLCAKATKKYDVLNEWLILSYSSDGVRKQIDNRRLLNHYESIHKGLIKNFNINHPIFWLGATHTDIKKLADLQVGTISLQLSQCGTKTIEITDVLCEKINSYKEISVSSAENTIFFYNEFGPLILDTIKAYEAITTKIKEIEKSSTKWLENFKERDKLFRKIQTKDKQIIRLYLQGQKEIELAAQREAERAAALEAQRRVPQRKKRTNNNKPVEKLTLTRESTSKNLSAKQEGKLTPQNVVMPIEKIEDGAKVPDITKTPPMPIIIEPVGLSENISSSLPEPIVQPKVKVKTRPNRLNMSIVSVEKATETALPLMLPEQLTTPEFTSFIENLLTEKNGRKLIKMFKELNTAYGIFSETGEKNNKGYFSVRSPITHKIHVCTYHHLHVDHPYASIFMAVRDVLIAADIIGR